MRSSRAISSASVAETISTIVFGWPGQIAAAISNLPRSGIDVRRIDVHVDRIGGGRLGSQRAVGGFGDFAIDFRLERFDLALVQNAFAHQEQRKFRKRIAVRLGFALLGRLVKLFVIGKRMRIGTRHVRMNQRRALCARGNAPRRGCSDVVAFQRIGAVAFLDVQMREIA